MVEGEPVAEAPAVLRAGAERASSRGTTEIAGASHATSVSQPEAVAATIAEAGKAYVASLAAAAV